MKQNKISRSRKRTLSQPDEFVTVSSKILKFVAEHKVMFSSVLATIVVFGIIVAGICFFSSQAESKAFAMLDAADMKYKTSLKEMGAAEALKEVNEDFRHILDKYSRRMAGKLTGVIFANRCFDAGDFDIENSCDIPQGRRKSKQKGVPKDRSDKEHDRRRKTNLSSLRRSKELQKAKECDQ